MRRAKLGDVFAVKVPNGYKIVQWAYRIEKFGNYIRVFDGLYDTLPDTSQFHSLRRVPTIPLE